jgi:hypothetical protein
MLYGHRGARRAGSEHTDEAARRRANAASRKHVVAVRPRAISACSGSATAAKPREARPWRALFRSDRIRRPNPVWTGRTRAFSFRIGRVTYAWTSQYWIHTPPTGWGSHIVTSSQAAGLRRRSSSEPFDPPPLGFGANYAAPRTLPGPHSVRARSVSETPAQGTGRSILAVPPSCPVAHDGAQNQFRRPELGHSPCRSARSVPRDVTVLDPHPPTGCGSRIVTAAMRSDA